MMIECTKCYFFSPYGLWEFLIFGVFGWQISPIGHCFWEMLVSITISLKELFDNRNNASPIQ